MQPEPYRSKFLSFTLLKITKNGKKKKKKKKKIGNSKRVHFQRNKIKRTCVERVTHTLRAGNSSQYRQ